MESHIYPLLFEPVYKHIIWGGDKLSSYIGIKTPECTLPVGESWLVTDRPGDQSVVANGAHKGLTLRELISSHPSKIVGSRHNPDEPFPLLIKIIDAAKRLSLQVHPDEMNCRKHPGTEAKTEMWYILDHEENALLYAGLRHNKTQLQFRTRVGTDKIEECLQKFPSRKGDAYYIPSGTVHSIGGGNLILEIQQNSDTTFRVHDWGRLDVDDNPRELHVVEALESIHFKDRALPLIRVDESPVTANKKRNLVQHNKYFKAEEIKLISNFFSSTSPKTFHTLTAIDSSFTLKYADGELAVRKGACCLLPAGLGSYGIVPEEGVPLTIVRSMLSM